MCIVQYTENAVLTKDNYLVETVNALFLFASTMVFGYLFQAGFRHEGRDFVVTDMSVFGNVKTQARKSSLT